MLQWGRTLMSAESPGKLILKLGAGHASMGPHSDECGIWLDYPIQQVTAMLQWGRTLMSAESDSTSRNPPTAVQVLQWGRTLMSAESRS